MSFMARDYASSIGGGSTLLGTIREEWQKNGHEKKFSQLNGELNKSSPSAKVWLEVWGSISHFVRNGVLLPLGK